MKLASFVVAASLFVATEAWAGDTHMFLPVGGSIGYGLNPKTPNGAVLGAEASLAFLHGDKLVWSGAYADVVHDFGADATRISIGPEVGWAFFGVDGGLVLSTRDGVHAGFCGRFLLSFLFIHAYMRVGHIVSSPNEGTYGEIGLMVKLPIPLEGGIDTPKRQYNERPPLPPDLPVAAPPPDTPVEEPPPDAPAPPP